ncbi:MAG: hypothetical protein LBP26_01820 [Clostridiales bacterium]|jgi:hypothetical protein|nr:hypothetical protein [Clostridiales bacterium]
MRCPVCGEEIAPGKTKCLRCGYAVKALAVRAEPDGGDKERASDGDIEVKEIGRDEIHMGRPRKGVGDIFGGGLFNGTLFGGISELVSDILGGFFSGDPFGELDAFNGEAEDDFPVDVFDRDFVEVEEIETIDPDDKPDKRGRRDGKRDG